MGVLARWVGFCILVKGSQADFPSPSLPSLAVTGGVKSTSPNGITGCEEYERGPDGTPTSGKCWAFGDCRMIQMGLGRERLKCSLHPGLCASFGACLWGKGLWVPSAKSLLILSFLLGLH